ncbi:nucleotidyltransferase family protein [Clostridium estertheticum]|uniref:Nucleotidyl transferase n=2 Tax=Clostridium estertheticum TaxID=238834 RepID=A0A1J0GHD3_9CLOT|nr:nucleotidyltransferase family protein [Clostridium estertheticum]APC40770.1 nucleotidyl transferase [Clostridium estertheticum subsp. estertheticum]MBU3074250.1 nucleotidyltransferase family protein [Clostridium estertheticum]MBU3164344.1 nucleotidyltransferase family protein [Clostridium estertheticum]MBU3184351.1 nucleotidyltransferase family protein [Clostridium estertheticum]MBZ9617389.1 nucleotidyltransferase family protein [Clostridium estertheticum subsp. laramiense]
MKFPIENYCIGTSSTIKEAMKVIDKNLTGGALVVNENNELVGTITDGDIRRAMLKGLSINNSIEGTYFKNFKFVTEEHSKKKAKEYMLSNKIRQVPVIDKDKKLIDLYFLDDILSYDKKDNYVFILAGGLGTRLRPLTETVPKPMLLVGDKPILELIIEQFKEYGFNNFIISLNYKGEIIEEYFEDGKKFGVNIEYIRETKKLGTAGSIALVKEKFIKPFIVINGDILTGIDFEKFLNHHIKNNFNITVGVRDYEVNVPYGVLVTDNMIIESLEEKPTYKFNINGGVYVVNPEVIKYIRKDEVYNMTDLIEDAMNNECKTGIYEITEYWKDIGQIDDYKKANTDIHKFFKL